MPRFRSLLTFLLLTAFVSVPLRAGDDDELLSKARSRYYSLHGEGLKELTCTARPEWDVFTESLRASGGTTDAVSELMRAMRFRIEIGPNGSTFISQVADLHPPDVPAQQRLVTSVGGVRQLLTTFYEVWLVFLDGFPIHSEDGPVKFGAANDGYRLTGKLGDAEALYVLNKDLEATEISTTHNGYLQRSLLRFAHAPSLILSGFDSVANNTTVVMEVETGEVDGLILPKRVVMTMDKLKMPFVFEDYQVTKKEAAPVR